MTAINLEWSAPRVARQSLVRVPWVAAFLLLCCFAMADWSWKASERWDAREKGRASELAGKISQGNASRQAGFLLIGALGIALLALPANRPGRLNLIVAYPVILFCGWAILSATWSDDRAMTLKRLATFVALLFAVIGFLKHYDIWQLAWVALIGSLVTSLAGCVLEAMNLLTRHGDLSDWRFGGMMHPNHAGLNCCVTLLASLYLYRLEKRRWMLLVFAFSFAVLFFTKSRTALMAAMTGLAAFWVLATPLSKLGWTLLIIAWLSAAGLWLNSMDMLPSASGFVTMGRGDVKDADVSKLTGRTDIWKYALLQAGRNPNRMPIGYGYETFWTPQNAQGVSEFMQFNISEGHCMYLDWYLELGLIGAGLFVLILLTAILRWTWAARRLASPSAALAAAVLLGGVVHGFAESSLGDPSLPTFLFYAAIAGAALLRPDEEGTLA